MELEDIRINSRIIGEKRYLALETLNGIVDWIKATKPSELMATGKTEIVSDEQTRALWQKWIDHVEELIFNKAIELPSLLVDDVITLFKEDRSAKPKGTSQGRKETTGE
jgi:hypothetical protein